MRTRLLFAMLAFLLVATSAQAKKEPQPQQYEIICAGSGTQGTYLVKVYVYAGKKSVSDADLIRAAVHGVIFRGFTGQQGCISQRPMVSSVTVEQQKADYFEPFFSAGGPYEGFATIIPGSYERVKGADRQVKIGAVLQVQKDNLRRELEQAGIIRGLSNGF